MTHPARGKHPRDLPDMPGPRASDRTVHNYLRLMAAYLGDAANHQHHHLETIMATVQELQTALDANTAATEAAAAAIGNEITQLKAAVDALASAAPTDLQPQVDQVTAATARLQTAVDALNADDAPAA